MAVLYVNAIKLICSRLAEMKQKKDI